MKTSEQLDAEAMADFRASCATVEDLARAWASIDGRREAFDEGKGKSVFDDATGHYAGYCVEARELIERATKYANKRR